MLAPKGLRQHQLAQFNRPSHTFTQAWIGEYARGDNFRQHRGCTCTECFKLAPTRGSSQSRQRYSCVCIPSPWRFPAGWWKSHPLERVRKNTDVEKTFNFIFSNVNWDTFNTQKTSGYKRPWSTALVLHFWPHAACPFSEYSFNLCGIPNWMEHLVLWKFMQCEQISWLFSTSVKPWDTSDQ